MYVNRVASASLSSTAYTHTNREREKLEKERGIMSLS